MHCIQQLQHLRLKLGVRVVPGWRPGGNRKLPGRWSGGPIGPLFVPLNLVAK